MGAAVSRLTKEDVYRKTNGYTQLFSYIFQFLLEKIKIEDLTQLHSERKCGEYVVVLGDAIAKFFNRLQIEPKSSASGEIHFIKASQLAAATPKQDKMKLCMKIAVFYIRIFQIYAALALSVMDEAGGPLGVAAERKGAQILGARPSAGGAGAGAAAGSEEVMEGGGKEDTPARRFIQIFLRKLNDTNKPITIMEKDKRGEYYVFQDIKGINVIVFYRQTEFVIYDYNINKAYTLYFNVQQDTAKSNYIFTFTTFKPHNSSQSKGYKIPNENKRVRILNDLSNFQDLYDKIIELYEINKEKLMEYDKNPFITERYPAVAQRHVGFAPPGYAPYQQPAQDWRPAQSWGPAQPAPYQQTQPFTDVRDTLRFIQAFKARPRPQPYCMGRAIQLLDSSLIRGAIKDTAYTSICSTSYRDASVPAKGSEISRSLGLSSLAALFYDDLESATPGLLNDSQKRYIEFLRHMKFLFHDKEVREFTGGPTRRDIMSGIRSQTPQECKSITGTAVVKGKDRIAEALKRIEMMYKIQIEHAAAAKTIMMKIFDRTKEGEIFLTRDVTKGGLPYLNKVAEEARELLYKYYVNCEGNYQIAAEILAKGIEHPPAGQGAMRL